MATEASADYNLAKAKSIGGERTNWEFADAQGAGKSAVKDVSGAAQSGGTTGKNKD